MKRGLLDKLVQTDDASFDQILNDIGDRLKLGETVDVEEYANRSPQHAERLRKAIPGIRALVRLGHNEAIASSDDDPHSELGQLGDYRIVREIGRGGMGVVYEAEQISLGRTVALKVLPFATMLDERNLQRFKNEARAAATLDHPHIVPVYGIGQERGVHYYAMKLVEGHSLAEFVQQLRGGSEIDTHDSLSNIDDDDPKVNQRDASADTVPLIQAEITTDASNDPQRDFRTVAKLGIQAAEALDFAHSQGILHRDIKPANLMLTAGGKLFITDFGLARIEADAGMTMTGDLLGTLRYMSPEQALGQRVVVDHRSDIYSLGATLYELATLRAVFDAVDRQQLMRQIAFDDPPPLRKLDRRIPKELETIILKAIEKNPVDRYSTAKELAEDLE